MLSTGGPDRKALAELAELFFTGVCTVPDGMGELIPCAQEAAAIRRCGFDARPGRLFRCPPLPDELVGGSPLLGHLSDAIDPASRFAAWHPKRAAVVGTAHLDPLSKTDRLLLAALERAPDQRLRKIDVQRKFWRIPASMLHPILDRLIAQDRITIADDWLYPLSRAEFEAKQREAGELERRPRLLYTNP
jgi:hypothetical protein